MAMPALTELHHESRLPMEGIPRPRAKGSVSSSLSVERPSPLTRASIASNGS